VLSQAAIALGILLVAWYVVGSQIGRTTAARLIQLAADLLQPIASEASLRWLGSNGGEIHFARARPPFRSFEVVVWVAPRAILPVWVLNQLRHRRDVIGIAAILADPPAVTFQLVDPSSPVGRRALRQTSPLGWPRETREFQGQSMILTAPDLDVPRRLLPPLEASFPGPRGSLVRLAASPDRPHLSISLADPGELAEAPEKLAPWLRQVVERVTY
jgi:hypothetical protein